MTTLQLDTVLALAAVAALTLPRYLSPGWRPLVRSAGIAALLGAAIATVLAADRAHRLGAIAVTDSELLLLADAYLLVALVLIILAVGGWRDR